MKICPLCISGYADNLQSCPVHYVTLFSASQFIGSKLNDEFVIEGFLGQGGMSYVYLARQTTLDRAVAIKIIRSDSTDISTELIARLQRESQVLARLNHPHIAKIYSCGLTQDSHLFIAMEYIKGLNLGQLMERGELTLPRAITILKQVALALSYAHAHGIIHRDVKPHNVIVCNEANNGDRTLLIDFGLAWSTGNINKQRLTQPGETVGTIEFMSPDQRTGGEPSPAWDIWSFGRMAEYILQTNGQMPACAVELVEICAQSTDSRLHVTMETVLERLEDVGRALDKSDVQTHPVKFRQTEVLNNSKRTKRHLSSKKVISALGCVAVATILLALLFFGAQLSTDSALATACPFLYKYMSGWFSSADLAAVGEWFYTHNRPLAARTVFAMECTGIGRALDSSSSDGRQISKANVLVNRAQAEGMIAHIDADNNNYPSAVKALKCSLADYMAATHLCNAQRNFAQSYKIMENCLATDGSLQTSNREMDYVQAMAKLFVFGTCTNIYPQTGDDALAFRCLDRDCFFDDRCSEQVTSNVLLFAQQFIAAGDQDKAQRMIDHARAILEGLGRVNDVQMRRLNDGIQRFHLE